MEQQSFPPPPDGGDEAAPEPEISNPPVAEGINVSDKRPLRSFFINLGLTTAGLVVLLIVLNFLAVLLAPLVPFSWEKGLVPQSILSSIRDSGDRGKEKALQALATRIASEMKLPEGMDITVHYSSGQTVNAFATLGGNVMVFEGLLDMMESEDELAMVMAHEIAHVKNRDAIKGLVRAFGLMLLFTGIQDSGAYVQNIANLGMASYSRSQEAAADEEAVKALGNMYGHAGGARAFFTTIAGRIEGRDVETAKKSALPTILASHPDTLDRIAKAGETADRLGIAREGELTPLSGALADE